MALPVINIASMRKWESATWDSGQTEAEVIGRVGQAVARCAMELTSPKDSILILAGKGHNGDDARAAVSFLTDRTVILLNMTAPESDLAALLPALAAGPALILDGLFGIGIDRPLTDSWRKIIAVVNSAGRPVLAIDTPSGLNADTGEIFGDAIQAMQTLTVGAPKIGLLGTAAERYVGRLEVTGKVGLVPCPVASELMWSEATDFRGLPPRRPVAAHKGSFGHVVLVAGSAGHHGAAVLATRGAQRAQPGLTTVFTQANTYQPVAAQLQSAMVGIWNQDTKFPATLSALLVGPGLADSAAITAVRPAFQQWWLDLEQPLVVDASALDLLPTGAFRQNACRVLTPHPGEAARLLKTTSQQIQADRVGAVRQISREYGNCWVVLKGHQTLTGRSEGPVYVNAFGNPHLAQGGSGDLLSGFVAGLLAQPPWQTDVGLTLRYAVWQHGTAADKLQHTRPNWIIEDLANEIGSARSGSDR